MTTNHHEPHGYHADLTSAEINRPLGELDAAIETVIATGSGVSTSLAVLAGAGQASLTVASAAGFATGDVIYIGRGGWFESRIIATASGTTITVTLNLANTYAIGTPVSKSPVELVDARGGLPTLGARIGLIESRVFDVRVYGALGGATYDTSAVQAAIDAASVGGGTVLFPFLCKVSVVTVSAPNVHLTATNGGGILNGTVRIGTGTTTTSLMRMDMSVRNMRFERESASTTVNAIELVNVIQVTIDGCSFGDYDAAIHVVPQLGENHVWQLIINNCRTGTMPGWGRPQYFFEVPTQPGATGIYHSTADTTISGCVVSSLITNISVIGADGIVIQGNTLFMPGGWEASAVKESNIAITLGAGVVITGNQCFESGRAGIVLYACQSFTITGNQLPFAAQHIMDSAILIAGGDQGGSSYNLGTITGNTMIFPSLHGIDIRDTCGNIVISGNQVRDAGSSSGGYYGAVGLGTVSHYGIQVANTCTEMIVVNNLCGANLNALDATWHSTHSGNMDSTGTPD